MGKTRQPHEKNGSEMKDEVSVQKEKRVISKISMERIDGRGIYSTVCLTMGPLGGACGKRANRALALGLPGGKPTPPSPLSSTFRGINAPACACTARRGVGNEGKTIPYVYGEPFLHSSLRQTSFLGGGLLTQSGLTASQIPQRRSQRTKEHSFVKGSLRGLESVAREGVGRRRNHGARKERTCSA